MNADQGISILNGKRPAPCTEPCAMIIFGGSGDLTRRKLIPALYSLFRQRLLPEGFSVLSLSRSPMSSEQYREILREWAARSDDSPHPESATWEPFSRLIEYLPADHTDPSTYEFLNQRLSGMCCTAGGAGNRIYYLATAPSAYVEIIRSLGRQSMACPEAGPPGSARIIVEKPFGRDLESARALNREVLAVFKEDQVYRIDHYLGKETVQNLLVFRFANGIFEPLWNRQYVSSVQITIAEDIGVGSRGSYYEEAGALRDMVQNHVLQLLTLVAMEPPPDFAPNSVRDEKAKVLRSIQPFTAEDALRTAVRGQYGPGRIAGREAPGYRQENGVAPDSNTETYAAIRFSVDNWRWAGVPFYVRTGKNLPRRATEISILFRRTPHFIFRQGAAAEREANVLTLRIQPDEGIALKFLAKLPGQSNDMRPVHMDFRYGTSFDVPLASAYERLLLDCMNGDPTLFDRADTVESAWRLVQPILDAWAADGSRSIPTYEAGTWGPPEAGALLARDDRCWWLT